MKSYYLILMLLFFISCHPESNLSASEIRLKKSEELLNESLRISDSVMKYRIEVDRCTDSFNVAFNKLMDTKDKKYLKEEGRWVDSIRKFCEIQKTFVK